MDEFNWEKYIERNNDLQKAGIKTKEAAWNHWINYGQYENRQYFYSENKSQIVNLIGITDIICSISDNLYMMERYMNKTYKVNIINNKNLKNITINNTEKYIFCLQPFEMHNIIWFLELFNFIFSFF